MTISHLTRGAVAGLAALSLAAPAAQAAQPDGTSVPVCNEASVAALGGTYTAVDGDPTPPARHTTGLQRHRGLGEGLVTAAERSPALQQCGEGDDAPGGGWDWGAVS